MEAHAVAVEHAHGPPEAHASSRIDRQTLGILLFIVSEVMLFGAFFASYFFIRVVANSGPWPPNGLSLPVGVAGVNTAILISSSFTVHWALESIRRGNRRAMIMDGLYTSQKHTAESRSTRRSLWLAVAMARIGAGAQPTQTRSSASPRCA